MSGLSEADREALAAILHRRLMPGQPHPADDPKAGRYCTALVVDLAPTVEAIVARHVTAALNEAADEAEWKWRQMSFFCGSGESETRLHPVGDWLRDRTRT